MNQNVVVSDYQLKLQEAEICYSMGLLNEALELYQRARFASSDPDKGDQEIIEQKISQIQAEIADWNESGYKMTSAEHISALQNSMPVEDWNS